MVLFINGTFENGQYGGNTRERNIFKTIADIWIDFSDRDIITKVRALVYFLCVKMLPNNADKLHFEEHFYVHLYVVGLNLFVSHEYMNIYQLTL